METRKIQQVSNGTFTVSLPKAWADAVGISTGTVVDLHTHIDGVLVIQPPGSDADSLETVAICTVDERPNHLKQTLRATYLAGPEEILLTSESGFTLKQQQAVRQVVRNLVGVTVTDESETHLRVRNLLNADEVSVRQSVRQLQFVALSMHRDATAALTGETPVDGVVDRDDRADRLYKMTDRYFTRSLVRLDEVDALGETRRELFYLHTVAREVERVADLAECIATVAADVDESLPDPIADEISEIARETRDAVESAVDAVFTVESVETSRDVLDTKERIHDELDSLEHRLLGEQGRDYRFARALHSLRRTADHATNIAEVGLRRAVQDGELDETVGDDAACNEGERRTSAS